MKATILIVEDDPDIQSMYQRILEDYLVLSALNGQDALDILKVCLPDLIILDWRMPRLDGHGFLMALARQSRLTACPIVVTSASNFVQDESRQFGVEFLSKPFNLSAFLDKVEALVPVAV